MRAFVTGSTGFLGIHLLQELAKEGWDIHAFHRATSDLKELKKIPGINFIVGDVRDKDSLLRGMPENADAVFHAAGSVGYFPPERGKMQYDINQRGTRNVVEVALNKKVRRFIHTSTCVTYDHTGGKRISENSPPNVSAKYAYDHSKYLAELEVENGAKQGLDAVFTHPAAVFGAYDKSNWSKMFREIQKGLPFPVAPPGKTNICHMRKVAQAHVSAFHKGRRGEHYILGGPDTNYMEIMQSVAKILDRPGPLFVMPPLFLKLFGRAEYRILTFLKKEPALTPEMADALCDDVLCDSTKAINELGYSMSPMETILMECYEWMVSEKMLPPKKTV